MAITFEQERKRQQYLAIATSFTVFLAVFVLWRGFFGSQAPAVESPVIEPPQLIIDFSVFDTDQFKRIGTAPEPAKAPDVIGRENPFIPF